MGCDSVLHLNTREPADQVPHVASPGRQLLDLCSIEHRYRGAADIAFAVQAGLCGRIDRVESHRPAHQRQFDLQRLTLRYLDLNTVLAVRHVRNDQSAEAGRYPFKPKLTLPITQGAETHAFDLQHGFDYGPSRQSVLESAYDRRRRPLGQDRAWREQNNPCSR